MYSIPSYKILVVGDSGAGKTSLVDRIISNNFGPATLPTVGVEFKTYSTLIDGSEVKLNIWDTAGQEKYRSVAKSYFRNGCGALVVFSIDSAESFDHIESWIDDISQGCLPNAAVLLVGNKSDLDSQRQVTTDEAQSLARRHGFNYIETSAKLNTNVQEAFVRLGKQVHDNALSGKLQGTFVAPINVMQTVEAKQPQKGCC